MGLREQSIKIFALLPAFLAVATIFTASPASAYTISMTTSGAQSIDVMPGLGSNTGTSIGADAINVVTDCRAGYNLNISTSVNDNNLYLNGNSSNNQSGKYFSPASGSTSLDNSPNTWGYLLSNSTPTSSSTFSAVPTSSNPAVLKTPASTASQTNINDSFNVYFGVSMANNLTPGTYKMIPDTNNSNADGSITYYLTMDTSCADRIISYNANTGSGSIANQIVTAGNSVDLADNAFTKTDYFFKGWSTNPSATSPEYRTNQNITPTSSMTLYAVWGDSTTTSLYDAVASLTRGTQTNDTNTTTGIQTNPTKATSGVYTYNASVFGASSDTSNDNPIYYYRGILDKSLANYGTDGDSMDYPNYVRIGNLCWRIIRTTGSGGVKIIYNGSYSGGTTANSCANATTNAQAGTSAFNNVNNINYNSIISAGYTFNNSYASTTSTTTAGNLFSTDSTFSNNSTRSTVKEYLEDTWYSNNINSYTSALEPSAGYCNDRSVYDNADTLLGDNASIVTPYNTASSEVTQYYFGARVRNTTNTQPPSLGCPRSTVDLYRYEANSTGTGNQLKKPISLLTADEASFAGSGSATPGHGSGYSVNSYLNSGATTLLLSPYYRKSDSNTIMLALYSDGRLSSTSAGYTNSVRPVISLKSGTTIESGSGTATSPWVIPELTMQTFSTTDFASMAIGETTRLKDERTGEYYEVKMISLNNTKTLWMASNLKLPAGTKLTSSDSNVSSDFTLSTESWTSNNQNYYCKQIMAVAGDEYYYNWYAATANPYECATPIAYNNSTAANDANSLGDICPKGWRIPVYTNELNNSNWRSDLLSDGSLTTTGRFMSGSQSYVGSYGYWWSSTRGSNYNAYYLEFNGSTLSGSGDSKYRGRSVRCMRTS